MITLGSYCPDMPGDLRLSVKHNIFLRALADQCLGDVEDDLDEMLETSPRIQMVFAESPVRISLVGQQYFVDRRGAPSRQPADNDRLFKVLILIRPQSQVFQTLAYASWRSLKLVKPICGWWEYI